MNHSFNTDMAKKYGLLEAVLLENIAHWLDKNLANNANFKEGRYWTYNSSKGFAQQFDYASAHQIRRALDSLVEKKVLIRSAFNKAGFDKTSWYTFADEFMFSDDFPFGKFAKSCGSFANVSGKFAKPIPDINTDINTDKKTEDIPRKRVSSAKTTLSEYLEQCKAAGTKPIPDDHCSRQYARDAGISPEMIALAWFSFLDTYRDGTGKSKKYVDWGLVFNNAVKGNWAKLWYVARDSGTVNWTSEGLLYKATIDAKLGDKK